MDEENQIEESEPIEIKPTGVPESVAIILCVLLLLTTAAAIYFAQNKPESAQFQANNAAIVAGANAQKAQIDLTTASVKRDLDLRMEVIKRCADKGNVPTLTAGNVDCKASPK